MSAPRTCEAVVPRRYMQISRHDFSCPYCSRSVHRGGKAEGFRKAGFASHVAQCWEILVFQRGYLPGRWLEDNSGHTPVSVANPPADLVDYVKRRSRAVKAHLAKRKREGQLPSY